MTENTLILNYMAFLPFVLFSVPIMATPGPNNLMIMCSGLNFGIRRSMPHFVGICFGFAVMIYLLALGLSLVFESHPFLRQILKYLGSFYLLYLAWCIAQIKKDNKENTLGKKPLGFFTAFFFQWMNPKVWVMAISAISLFHFSHNIQYNALILSGSCFLLNMLCLSLWLGLGTGAQKLMKTEQHYFLFNRVMAVILVMSILVLWI